jgi:hypothetical protein
MSSRDEQTVRAFLAPLRTIPPVTRRPRELQRRVPELVALAAIAVGAFALLALVALLAAHRSPSTPPPTHPAGHPARTSGMIAVSGEHGVIAFDPAHRRPPVTITSQPGTPLAFSADGTNLLVVRTDGLYVISADGIERETKVAAAGTAGGSFTPDGAAVIYGAKGSIWRVAISGGPPTTIAWSSKYAAKTFPGFTGGQLSPDGTTIVYDRATGIHPSDQSIWLMDTNGRNRRPLVSYQQVAALTGFTGQLDIFALAWYPDSSRLLVIAAPMLHGPDCAVLSVSRDGSDLRRFGPTDICPARAAAEPGGSHFAFTGLDPRHDTITITTLDGQTTENVKPPGAYEPFFTWAP